MNLKGETVQGPSMIPNITPGFYTVAHNGGVKANVQAK